jgi:hypothetical protein
MSSKNKYNICTIVSKNYIAFARTLYQSFMALHPDGKCYILIIDDIEGYIDPVKEDFEIVKIDDLGIKNIRGFCFKYSIVELSTAFKPYLLKYLLDSKSIDRIFYIDPDILVMNPLDSLYGTLDNYDMILTPHIDKDYPDDGFLPNDSVIMKHGILNLGFIGLRKCTNVNIFLLWWQRKLYDKCLMDHKKGYFVDQKYIDLALTLFENYKIIKEPGYNVAFWNLHSRLISFDKEQWYCNDELLYFFHFSSYKPENPKIISPYQTRFKFEDNPILFSLYSQYHKLLLTNDYFNTYKWPYSYNYFSNGQRINNLIRRLYRRITIKINFVDPFNIKEFSFFHRILFPILRLYNDIYIILAKFIIRTLKITKH